MKLTRELLHLAASNGDAGWNKAQLELLGVKWPPAKGWLSALVGTEIDDVAWHQVMALSGVKRKQRKEILNRQQKLI